MFRKSQKEMKLVKELEKCRREIEKDKAVINSLEVTIEWREKEVLREALGKKIEIEDIQHMMMMKEEHMYLENQKKRTKLERQLQTQIAEVRDKYRGKLEDFLANETSNVKDLLKEILQRLPNVDVLIGNNTK